jgi:hypothetical protein
MTIIQEAITGKPKAIPQGINPKIYEALEHFYTAFNSKDYTLMESNWLNSEEVTMDNPLGGIKRGWEEIKSIYQKIFSGKAEVYVEYYDYSIFTFKDGFCAVGRERGFVEVEGVKLELAIRTSRVYKAIGESYKQVHHHGSIEDATLLQNYQDLLK